MTNLMLLSISDNVYYVIAGVLSLAVLFGIHLMSQVKTAKTGNILSAGALLTGVVVTLIRYDILPVWVLYVAMAIGAVIGLWISVKVKIIEMPQLIALLNGLGGLASFIVGGYALLGIGSDQQVFSLLVAMLAVIIGALTFSGSMVAAGKLHRVITQKPIVIKFHQSVTRILIALLALGFIYPAFTTAGLTVVLVITIIVAFLFGILFTIRIGGADMPIAISLLNSLSGVAAAISGLAIGDPLLVAVGGIVGASGLLLTQIMCKAMNRKLIEILLGKTTVQKTDKIKTEKQAVDEEIEEDAVDENVPYLDVIKNAQDIIIVPGYGMAVAQAQHLVKQLADTLKKQGATVRFAIHPVAGRMPGHMNVLLAEADVDYDDLYEMDDLNDEFQKIDLAIVIGANDVVNSAARDQEDTPIYGMPILNVDEAKEVFIFNYDLNPGYSGVDNPLYKRKKGVHMFLGNALETLQKLADEMK